MKKRKEKGYTGVDISISIVIFFIFVSIISFLIYRINSNTSAVEKKSKAADIALHSIEELKAVDYNEIVNLGTDSEEQYDGLVSNVEDGYIRTVYIEDYAHISEDSNVIPGLVKKATVKVEYTFKNERNKVELSTIISKEI